MSQGATIVCPWRQEFMALVLLVLTAAAAAQSTAGMLNSERIEARFGSYGIEVLSSDSGTRVSNLYSANTGSPGRTTRTVALVEYPSTVPMAIASVHDAIVAGGSIGATFKANGWNVVKTNLYLGERPSNRHFETRMHLQAAAALAVHVYVLDVERDGTRIPYARILEVHHPDYLSLSDLYGIYAPDGLTGDPAVADRMLQALARQGF